MRHTLLPLYERKLLRREYFFRVMIVLFFLSSLSVLLGIASIFPVYIKAADLKRESDLEVSRINKKNGDSSLKNIQKSVANSLILLNYLEKNNENIEISSLIEEVLNMRGELSISSFSSTKTSTTTFSMNIQGIAPTRKSLLDFKSNFEGLREGNKVNLPVSELAKNSKIPFSLELKQKIK